MRRARRWLPIVMILGFTCAQFISLARACTVDRDVAPATESAMMLADCPLMAHGSATQVPCEALCIPQAQADKGIDVHIALAPPAILVVRQPPVIHTCIERAMAPLARSASPPLSLLFGRFLI